MARNGKDNLREGTAANPTMLTSQLDASGWQSALIDLSFESIFAWDWELGIIEWNAGAERQYGFKRAEVLGKNSHEILATKHPISLRRFLKKLQADGHWVGEVRHTTKDGRELIVESRQQVIVQDGRRVVVESNRDITERRAGEGQNAFLIIIGELINKLNNPDELLFAASKAVGQYFRARRCLFNEIDLEKDLEIVHRDYCRGVASVAGIHKLSAYSSITSTEMIAGRTVSNSDSKTDPRTATLYKKTYEPAGERSYIAVPLMRDGQWKASLWISDDQPRSWSQGEVSLLEVVGERIWHAVEKSRNEAALRESEESYRVLAESASDAIIRIDEESIINFVNTAATRIFGYAEAEMIGHPLTMLMPEDLRPEHRAGFVRYLKTGVRKLNWESVQVPARHKDGHQFPIEISFGEYNRDEKRFFIGIVRDITERKRAEEILNESEERFRSLFVSAPMAVFVCDRDAVIQHYNEHAVKLWGREPTCGVEKHCGSMKLWLPGGDLLPHEQSPMVEVLRTGIPAFNVEVFIERPDGSRLPVLVNFAALKNQKGEITGAITSFIDITDRVKAEQVLLESEERRQLAQEAGNIGIFDWDIIAGRTYWSETMWSFYGEEPGDNNPDEAFWSGHLHDDDRERVKRNLRRVVKSDGDEFRDEFRIVRSDGSIGWMEARAKVSHDASGRATRMYGVNIDITARKEAEERIRLSDNQLRLVTNAVPALISYVDKDEHYRFANARFTDWFGIPTDKIIGKGPRDIFGLETYRVIKPKIDEALSGRKCTFETVLSYKHGGDKYVHISYIPDVGADGAVYGYYGLIHDMTELKHSEDLLRSSEERMGLMMESLADYAIFSLDGEGVINSWNKGAEIIYGYSQKEVLGRFYEFTFTPDDIARDVALREMKNARLKGRAQYEGWRLKKDGSQFYANAVMMPLYVGETLTGYAKIVSDLTEKKRHAEELQQAHDELEIRVKERTSELADSNAALVLEMLQREITEKQRIDLLRRLVSSQEFERRRIARDLHDQMGQRLTALRLKIASLHEISPDDEQFIPRVNSLQEIAERLDSEISFLAWELRPTALDDLGLLEAVAAFVNEWSRHFEIPADFHSSGLSKDRLGHEIETHLYRITQEALNNITKHADAKHVTVLLERRDQSVILIIEDNGKGFDTAEKRVSSESGKGLGLVGMGERAALVGGEIEIESAHGKGTTIYVRVPFSN